MAECVCEKINSVDSRCQNIDHTQEAFMHGEVLKVDSELELLDRLNMDITCSSEKLLNLELCITNMSLHENDFSAESGNVSEVQMENILVMDLSLGYLESELDDLGNFLDCLMIKVASGRKKLSLSDKLNEQLTLLQEKLQVAEATLTNVQEKLLEIKRQLGSARIVLGAFGLNNDAACVYAGEKNHEGKSGTFCRKELLRMLDKSISDEISLEDKLLKMKQSKGELAETLYVTDQALSSMELSMELAWVRLNEAENLAMIFKEIAREMFSKIQALHLDLNRSLHQENQLNSKTMALQNSKINCTDSSAVFDNGGIDNGYSSYIHNSNDFMEKVKILEEKLTSSDSNDAPTAGPGDSRLFKMEDLLESMRHSLFIAESRADSAEAKLAELTESHLELNEELTFLKGGENSSGQKISLLEKQVRDLEKQVLHAKASSKTSHEQQNMLYSAIWDMETLIEDLKSKVSKAETKFENAEERCLKLAETNSELYKEIGVLKSRNEGLEASLKEGNQVTVSRSKDINCGAKIIADMVFGLARERERVEKQLSGLARENRILMAEVRKLRKNGSAKTTENNRDVEADKEICSSVNNEAAERSASAEELQETLSTSNQINDEPLEEADMSNESRAGSSESPGNVSEEGDDTTTVASTMAQDEEGKQIPATRDLNDRPRRYLLIAIVIAAGAMIVGRKQEMFAYYLRGYMGV